MSGASAREQAQFEAARLLLHPASIAVVGATEDRGKFGGRLYGLLVDHRYPGHLYPINPRRDELLGLRAYPDLASLPEAPDLAVIVLPRPQVLGAVMACADRGIPGAVVISSGYAEAGAEGEADQAVLTRIARETGPRLLGPNCLGLVNAHDRVVACATVAFAGRPMIPGGVSIISQSGAMMTTLATRAEDQAMGLRYLVSTGNEADLDVCDFMAVCLEDPETSVIGLFLEHIRRPALFRELARGARERGKPVVAVKIGRSAASATVARSHTGSITGDDALIDAVLREDGVVRVGSVEALLFTAQAFALTPPATGRSAFVVSASGGACGILADLAADAGLHLAPVGDHLRSALEPFYSLPAMNNPIDLGGMKPDAGLFQPDTVEACLDAIGSDPGVGGLVFSLTSQPYVADHARRVAAFARRWDRPVIVYGGIGSVGQEALDTARSAGLPVITDAEQCIRTAAALMGRGGPASNPPFTPHVPPVPALPAEAGALTEVESKAILAEWGLPVPRELLATSPEEAVEAARQIGGPVAMKVVSPDILHKTEVGGVTLGIQGPEAAGAAYQEILARVRALRPEARIEGVLVQEMVDGVEVILGARRDPQFGPFVMAGLGGVFVELLKDVSIRPAPVSPEAARSMLEELRGYPLLRGYRGAPPADVEALADAVVSFSLLASALGERLEEIDLNPVMVLTEGRGVRIVDALVVLGPA